MAKKDEDNLRHQLDLHRAMQLVKYREPHPIDVDAALEKSTETSRLGGKVAKGYVVFALHGIAEARVATFNKRRVLDSDLDELSDVFEDPTLALIGYRNKLAKQFAERLLKIDVEIEKYITGSGLGGATMMTSDSGSPADVPATVVDDSESVNGKSAADMLFEIKDDTIKMMVMGYLGKHGLSMGHAGDVAKAIRIVENADKKTQAELAGKLEPKPKAPKKLPPKRAIPAASATKKPKKVSDR